MVVDFLESIVGENSQRGGAAAPQTNGVVDALQHSKLAQVDLGGLRLRDEEEGRKREGGMRTGVS